MSQRSTYLLFAIAMVFTGAVVLSYHPPAASPRAAADVIFPGLTPNNLREVTLTSGEFQSVLTREVLGWRVSYLERGQRVVEDFADEDRVLELATELMSLEPLGPPVVISGRDLSTWAGYGLGSLDKARGDSISVHYGSARKSLYLGNEAGERQVYARCDDRLIKIDVRLCRWLQSARNNPDFLRSARCFPLLGERTPLRLIWQSGDDEKVVLLYRDGRWFIENGPRADTRVCDRLLQAMRRMRIVAFEATQAGFAEGSMVIGYQSEDSEEYAILDTRTPVDVGPTACTRAGRVFWDKGKRRIASRYLIPSALVRDIPMRTEKFRDFNLLAFSPVTARKICYNGSSKWTIERMPGLWWTGVGTAALLDQSEWWVTFPTLGRLDGNLVRGYLEKLGAISAKSFVNDVRVPELSQSLILEFPPDHKPSRLEIRWSESPPAGLDLLPIEVESVVRLFSPSAVRELKPNYAAFYNRRADAFNFSQVCECTVMRPDRTYRIYQKDGRWWLTEPVAAPAEKDHVEDILRGCAWVMAEEVLGEERMRDEYGCRNSPYRLHIRTQVDESGPAIFREIEVGSELGEEHCAIWISGFPYVYKVPIALKRAMEREFSYCGWLPEGLSLKNATAIEIIRPEKRFRRQGQSWFLSGEKLPAAKAQELDRRLEQIRIRKILAFTAASSSDYEPALMTICAGYSDRTITLKLVRREDRFVGVVTGRDEILQLENEAVAVLLHETE